jgi:Large polyvalent protein associated domain 29
MSSTYLSCAETAKLVRSALKKAFPGVKFSVRSSVYSGGASIQVGWTDGPSTKAVEAVAKAYEGGGFDGMIDMAYNKDSWLMPDGSAAFASSPGTTGSMGVYAPYNHAAPAPGATKVSFGADYVFCNKSWSVEAYTAAVKTVTERYGMEMPEIVGDTGFVHFKGHYMVPGSDMSLDVAVNRELNS